MKIMPQLISSNIAGSELVVDGGITHV